jgi:23S rRNA (guanosine2251-2'-O)-methyltransferase
MAGNSQRRGALRKAGSKKGQTVGSGGQRSKGLQGKGPTPPAEARKGHPKARRAAAASRRAERPGQSGRSGAVSRRSSRGSTEIVAGRNPVVEALRASVPATALYVASRIDTDDRVREVLTLATQRNLPLLEAPRPELDRLSGGGVHQGLVLQVPPYTYAHPADLLERAAEAGESPFLVVLDGVTDPRNLGAVVRSAAAFGAHGVVVPQRRAAGMTATAWKTSAGAAARVPVAQATNLTRVLESYQQAGCFVIGLAAAGSAGLTDVKAAADGPVVVVVGAEDKGLSRLVAQTCDLVVSIPMHNDTESLNASVAAAIVMHEVARARRHP